MKRVGSDLYKRFSLYLKMQLFCSKLIIVVCFFLVPLLVIGQTKYEREFKMNVDNVPKQAQDFVRSFEPQKRLRWYKESGISDETIEAKFRYKGKKMSVEFDTLGSLQDLEFVIGRAEIPGEINRKLQHQLDSLFQNWKIQKIQMHYEGQPNDIRNAVVNGEIMNLTVLYEIVLKARNKKVGSHLFEISIRKDGDIQQISKILQDKADHLEY